MLAQELLNVDLSEAAAKISSSVNNAIVSGGESGATEAVRAIQSAFSANPFSA